MRDFLIPSTVYWSRAHFLGAMIIPFHSLVWYERLSGQQISRKAAGWLWYLQDHACKLRGVDCMLDDSGVYKKRIRNSKLQSRCEFR